MSGKQAQKPGKFKEASLTNAEKLKIFTNLIRANQFDRRMEARLLNGQMIGMWHAAEGSIGPGVGLCSLLNKDDNLTPHHRAHGTAHMLSKGADVKTYVAEHSGKIEGCCAGRSTYHFCYPEDKVYLMSALLGYAPQVATGWGWAAKRRGEGQVVACCTGDAAYSQGRMHESMIFASTHKLPIIYLCENNGFSVSTPTSETHPTEDFADMAASYNMPSVVVDGQDVFAVAKYAKWAIARARKGEGPSMIEAKVFRYSPHSVGIPDIEGWTPRDQKALDAEFKKRNPVTIAEKQVLEEGLLDEDGIARIHKEAAEEFDAVTKWVDKECSNASDTVEELLEQVYA